MVQEKWEEGIQGMGRRQNNDICSRETEGVITAVLLRLQVAETHSNISKSKRDLIGSYKRKVRKWSRFRYRKDQVPKICHQDQSLHLLALLFSVLTSQVISL